MITLLPFLYKKNAESSRAIASAAFRSFGTWSIVGVEQNKETL